MKFWEFIFLTVHVGELGARVPFLVVQNLAVDCSLGTSFINHHVKAVVPGLLQAVFQHFLSVAITGRRSLNKPHKIIAIEFEERSQKNRTTRKITVVPTSYANFQAQRLFAELCSI